MRHVCKHDSLRHAEVIQTRRSIDTTEQVATTLGPIRIQFEFSFLDRDPFACTAAGQSVQLGNTTVVCGSDDILTLEKRAYLQQTVLADARSWFQKVLNVHRSPFALSVEAKDCGCGDKDVDVSSLHNKSFADVDLLIVVTARSTRNLDANGATVAFSCACQVDSSGRSNVARINWAPATIVLDRPDLRFEAAGVAIHELTHALGFSLQSFQRLPNIADPVIMRTRSAIIDGIMQTHPVTLLNLPTVTAWARSHFGCAELDGVELESQGATGTASSHWEKRLFNDELMTATTQYVPVRSNLTLLFLQATGWYTVNFEYAEPLLFGAGQGCDFAAPRCDKWPASYRCTYEQRNTQQCLWSGTERGRCSMIQYSSDLPVWYQYVPDHPNSGGQQLSDYCPLFDRQNYGDCRQPLYQLDRLELRGELYGADSRCAPSSLFRDGRSPPASDGGNGAGCHAMVCDVDKGRMMIRVAYQWLECGKDLSLSALDGSVSCPSDVDCAQLRAVSAQDWAVIDSVEASETDSTLVNVVVRGSRLASTTHVIVETFDDCNVTRVNDTTVECEWFNTKSGVAHWLDVTVARNDSILTTTSSGALQIGTGDLIAIVAATVSIVAIALAVLGVILWKRRGMLSRDR